MSCAVGKRAGVRSSGSSLLQLHGLRHSEHEQLASDGQLERSVAGETQ